MYSEFFELIVPVITIITMRRDTLLALRVILKIPFLFEGLVHFDSRIVKVTRREASDPPVTLTIMILIGLCIPPPVRYYLNEI